MLAIQNAVLRFLAVSNSQAIKPTLLRLCRKQRLQPTQPPQPVPQQPAPTEPTEDTTAIQEDDLYPAENAAEDRFAAWEADHDEKLHQAEMLEDKGLILFRKAALLRA